MKYTTKYARSLSDEQLQQTVERLTKEVRAAHSLLDAARRERNRRANKKRAKPVEAMA